MVSWMLSRRSVGNTVVTSMKFLLRMLSIPMVVATLTAADVAEQVVEAITANRFWILTHDQYRSVIMQHASGVGTAARPAPAPIW